MRAVGNVSELTRRLQTDVIIAGKQGKYDRSSVMIDDYVWQVLVVHRMLDDFRHDGFIHNELSYALLAENRLCGVIGDATGLSHEDVLSSISDYQADKDDETSCENYGDSGNRNKRGNHRSFCRSWTISMAWKGSFY